MQTVDLEEYRRKLAAMTLEETRAYVADLRQDWMRWADEEETAGKSAFARALRRYAPEVP
jgi:hypothetical protein